MDNEKKEKKEEKEEKDVLKREMLKNQVTVKNTKTGLIHVLPKEIWVNGKLSETDRDLKLIK
ncbi:MAG: hypothetical protein GY870_15025 [archaeon]|nr:hypothetical protein [archaeon]